MHDRLAEMGRPLPPGVRQSLSSPPALRETYTKLKRTSTPRVPRPVPQGIGQDFTDLGGEGIVCSNFLASLLAWSFCPPLKLF